MQRWGDHLHPGERMQRSGDHLAPLRTNAALRGSPSTSASECYSRGSRSAPTNELLRSGEPLAPPRHRKLTASPKQRAARENKRHTPAATIVLPQCCSNMARIAATVHCSDNHSLTNNTETVHRNGAVVRFRVALRGGLHLLRAAQCVLTCSSPTLAWSVASPWAQGVNLRHFLGLARTGRELCHW